ncbi:MAG: lipoate--protein ligase family protein [Singulisphaera sp.]
METWRLVETAAAPGDWNMAVDAALLESVAAHGVPCLRFYAWSVPTVSLGYFQNYKDRESHVASLSCPIVRRSTGGGAIVHDREVTYSLVIPAEHSRAAHPPDLYQLVHRALVEALAEWQLTATICPGAEKRPPADEPFLCFQRRSCGDVLLGAAKIAGSAQRRRRGAILQHGSVLFEKSAAAPELFGISEVGGRTLPMGDVARAWRERLGKTWGVCWHPRGLDAVEEQRAAAIVQQTYGQSDWTQRR